ncbi:unnamed protein product [Acanthoscelides obtectus]|uniref:BRCT domain-containing protein n=1 Tax=Acanthoscelides obtectus TaxID=200917 RepID=A0A9P0KJI8_ACAOB|nr:unnamed protein product [Acanthoscelides obtectus]CAK1675258.1 DNA topoisomerase 2-binding protein 1-A [Acanthoscelides obtectus]
MDKVRILFVLSRKYNNESQASESMHQAFEVCQQNKCNVKWVKESEVDTESVGKTDFVVFEEFKGSCFESLKQTKCALIGPWTISVCLLEGKAIPNYPWPMFNVAMYGCIVTASCLSSPKKAKADIKTKVELMGGCYSDDLITKTTHLVIGSVMSEKYLLAAEANVSLMKPSWIEDVWKQSQNASVHACDEMFSKHRAKAFDGLTISTTGLTTASERHAVEKMITENGGKFTGKLIVMDTNVLVCGGPEATNSEKYRAARRAQHIKCVTLEWVTDSIEKGYALPSQKYHVQKVTSTPTKNDSINPDISTLSAILPSNMSHRGIVEESLLSSSKGNQKRKAESNYEDLVEKLDVKKAKKAGQYLDGYSIYVTGFSADQTEKLIKILNFSGATRNEKFSDSVTHVIVGDVTSHEVNLIKSKRYSCSLVSVQWLLDSIDQERAVSEEKYLISHVEMEHSLGGLVSPLSKKGLSLLKSNKTRTETDADCDMDGIIPIPGECEDNIVRQYLESNTGSQDTLAKLLNDVDDSNLLKHDNVALPPPQSQFKPPETSTQQSSMSVTQDQSTLCIFGNTKFMIMGFDEQRHAQLREKIEDLGGEVVPKNSKGVPDYLVVPIFSMNIHQTASEIVNEIFIAECDDTGKLLTEISYYHRPHDVPDTKCLSNCVIAVSSYIGFERQFLRCLIEYLGGLPQEQFARVTLEAKGVYGCTHLVSATATGKKYEAAVKWGRPVVSKLWLLECAKTGKKEWEGDFLLGDSKAPERREETKAAGTETICDENSRPGFANTPETSRCRTPQPPGSSKAEKACTPNNQISQLKNTFGITDQQFSPITPVNQIMRRFRNKSPEKQASEKKDDKTSTHYEPWDFIKTPDTPLGRIFTPNPSPRLRKMCEYWLMQFPDRCPKDSDSNASTPLSEIKERLWNKVLRKNVEQPNFDDSKEDAVASAVDEPTTPENKFLEGKFKQLEDMLTASGSGKRQSRNFQSINPAPAGNREYQDSQPCTVGWDFKQGDSSPKKPIFTLSNLSDKDRKEMTFMIESLGGVVSELANYDPACTHLICPKPCRNEKPLACMAAGKWILHSNYIYESKKRMKFLNEEEYEFGNPKSAGNFDVPEDIERSRLTRSHWWRKEIARRGYKAFNDMRAIIFAEKREPILRVIEAGGGVVVDVKPPFDDHVHATHCLIDNKYVSSDLSAYIPLAEQGIYLVPTVYVSDYLYNPSKEIKDCIIPYFAKYYFRS